MLYSLLRNLLFRFDAEKTHDFSLDSLDRLYRLGFYGRTTALQQSSGFQCLGMRFPNPVGLAAGLDKNGDYFEALGALGFGFVEVGTITPRPQTGNPQPRLFRIPEQQALINRMGFNNKGVDYLVERLKASQYAGVLGVNIGKNKTTPEACAVDDYRLCLDKVYQYCDYITVNISSPNTPGLRKLQGTDHLSPLAEALLNRRAELVNTYGYQRPILFKIAPDLDAQALTTIAKTCESAGVDGLIISNTTIERPGFANTHWQSEAGGCSGLPVQNLATQALKTARAAVADDYPIIGVGGIFTAEDAWDKIVAGASLLQVYTGWVYEGPWMVKEVLSGILTRLEARGMDRLSEAVGCEGKSDRF